MSAAVAQRLLALAAVALLAGVIARAAVEQRSDSANATPAPTGAAAPGGGWYSALAASRELHDELITVLGETEFGIGVSAGRAIAGHIGAQARFEYTVIGDPVNEAARLTELAKLEPGHVLASAIAVSGALDAEALCWDVGEIVELRGRTAPTQLARPLNLVSPSDVGLRDDVASDVSSS